MSGKYLVSVDLGTTGTKAVVFDLKGVQVGSANLNSPTYFPRPGRVEQVAEEVIENLYASTRLAVERSAVDPKDILGISFTHMCTTFVPVDKDGKFLSRIILWNDTRGGEMFDDVREIWRSHGITEQQDYEYTGYPLGPLATLPKVMWIKKNLPEVYAKTYKFVGMQALMISAFSDAEEYLDDKPGVIYTKLANLETFELDAERAKWYDIDLGKYPRRIAPAVKVGAVTPEAALKTGLLPGTPVYAGAGDQRCAAVGAGVAKDGMLSAILGTAGVVHAYSSKPIRHPQGKISIMGHAGTGNWQVEGSSSSGASSFRWIRDTIGQLESSTSTLMKRDVYDVMSEIAAQSPAGSRGVVYGPWLAGADCPRFDVDARATFAGLSFSHTKSDMFRAVMEGAAYEMKAMIEVAEEALGGEVSTVRVVGGAAASELWTQIQADIYDKTVETITSSEATALAAAMFVAIGSGVYKDVHEAIENMVQVKQVFYPNQENVKRYQELYEIYTLLYTALAKDVFPRIKTYQDTYVTELS